MRDHRRARRFIANYRKLAPKVGQVQWRELFEKGTTNRYAAATHLNDLCGAAPVQVASYQVQEQIDSWLGNRANEFREAVGQTWREMRSRHKVWCLVLKSNKSQSRV